MRADVWEPSERCPLRGDAELLPPGCEALPKNFRKTFLIGRELANAMERTVQRAKEIPPREFIFKSHEWYTRVTNIKFRVGAAAIRPGLRGIIAYTKRAAYVCTNHTIPDDSNCKDDEYQNVPTDFPLVPQRKGEYLKTVTNLVDFGPVKWLTTPAEIPPEMFIGLPSDFLTDTAKYYKNPRNHAYGAEYKLPGFGKQAMSCDNNTDCWIIGLGGDELGYMVPIVDIRFRCVYSDGYCDNLPMTFKDARSMSGLECRWVIENPEEAKRKYGKDAYDINFICKYGLIFQASNHYEETNGMSWNLASDWIRSVEQVAK